jgi:hypothetical protein
VLDLLRELLFYLGILATVVLIWSALWWILIFIAQSRSG